VEYAGSGPSTSRGSDMKLVLVRHSGRYLAVLLAVLATWPLPGSAMPGQIHEAARQGSPAKIKELVAVPLDALTKGDEEGMTALHVAAASDQRETVELLRRFRTGHPDVPGIVITSCPSSDLMRQAMRHGPITLLAKPVNNEQLLRSVRVALSGSLAGR